MKFKIQIDHLKAVDQQQNLLKDRQKKSQNRTKMTCKNRSEPSTRWRRAGKTEEGWEMISFIKSFSQTEKLKVQS